MNKKTDDTLEAETFPVPDQEAPVGVQEAQAVVADTAAEPVSWGKAFRTALWVNTTYFAEGLPLIITLRLGTVFFTDIGASLTSIGYVNFLGLPWNFKFLWAPLLDIFGTKRRWLVSLQTIVGLVVLGVAWAAWRVPMANPHGHLTAIALMLVMLAFVAATNDIAIDAYYMEAIKGIREQAAYTGHKAMGYRLAVIAGVTGLLGLSAVSADKHLDWALAFGVGGATMLAFALFHYLVLPRPEQARVTRPDLRGTFATFGRAFWSYLQQDKIALVLLFILTYKIGDEILFSMNTAFLMRGLGVTKGQLSWLAGVVGAGTTIVGAMAGSYWIKRNGLRKAIWPLTILMNFNIWAYVWLAWAKPDPGTSQGFAMIAFVHGYENLAAALGNAVLLVYLLTTCKAEFKAAHYAIGSAIMSIPSRVVGGFGGAIAAQIGFLNFFILGFLVSLPSMLLLFVVPLKDDAAPARAPAPAGH
jgi:MFS transporter, PAT family, beta-lactamase induction signal transducer AmpG